MSAALVQSAHNDVTGATSISVTLGSAVTPGNLLVAVLTSNNTATTPVISWGVSVDVTTVAGAQTLIYSKSAGVSESTTITFTEAASRNMGLAVSEFSPNAGYTFSLDKTAIATGTGVTSLAIGPTATLGAADDVAVAGVGLSAASGTATPTLSGMTINGGLSAVARGFAGYAVLAANTALSTTGAWTTSGNANGAVATYKQTAVAVSQNSAFLTLL